MTLQSPLVLQNAATPVSYSASTFRRLIDAVLVSGVAGYPDLRVVQRGAGANMSVDVAPGSVIVGGIDGPYVCASTATVNLPVDPAPGAGSRIDLVVATVRDSQATGSGTDSDWILDVVTGTPSGSPLVPTTPNYSTVLAHITVPSGTASITTPRIADWRMAANAPADRWSTLPAQGRAGQLIGTPDGKAWVFDSGWKELGRAADTSFGRRDLAGLTGTGAFVTYGTPITFSAPGRAAVIEAAFSCYIVSANGSLAVGRASLQISDDNGVTFDSPSDKLGSSANTFAPAGLSDTWQFLTAGAGTIVVRARIQSESGTCEFHAGTLTAKMFPV